MVQKKVVIIGAGMTGLVAGYRLSQKGYKVTIYEKGSDIGGLMGGFKIADTSLEKTYHHIFKTDKYIIDLIKELGLGSKLKWYPDKTALFYDHKMYPFMGAIDLLKFKPLNLIDKLRLGLVKIWLERDGNWEKYEAITADEWMKKWCGKRAYEVIWEPLLKGKFDKYYDKVSMVWMWARIHTRANSDGHLGYLEGGFQQITDRLAKRIKENGGEILLNTEFRALASPPKADRLAPTIYTGPSKEIDYLGAVCVVFTSEQSLSPYYWHNINDVHSPFLCFIQHTNLVDKKNYGGKNVYYLGAYGDPKQNVNNWFKYLKKIFPEFEEKLVEEKQVFRFDKAQHVADIKYKIPNSKLKKNVYVANFAQIYPEDRGINFAVREGEKISKLLTK
jgi:protoporphyrinogen oxidase